MDQILAAAFKAGYLIYGFGICNETTFEALRC